MKTISQFIVNVCNLVEAEGAALRTAVRQEGRMMRRATGDLAITIAWLLICIPLVLLGLCLLSAGLMCWLDTMVSRPLVFAITGASVLAVGVSGFVCFKAYVGDEPS